ncbi:MAG: DNA polymerase/3'-5' exonuclease PolX [Planctomycetes bacterium]|nr:DNA polymerase/3'-5' exonuclease PolX [Planctomycetota bacterium]
MKSRELYAIFEQMADLMEIQGEQSFRVNSYRRAARTMKELTTDIDELAKTGGIVELPGIGKGMAGKIEEYLASGKIAAHQELLQAVPPELPALLEVPGLGPKKVALAWKELGVVDVTTLKSAIDSGKLAKLKGLGEKSVLQISEGLSFAEKSTGRTPLGLAMPLAEELVAAMRAVKGVRRAEYCGSLRRGAETIGDVDILCESDDGAAVVKAFTSLPQAKKVLASGTTKGSILVERRDGVQVQADCRVVPKASFGAALQYFTGSKEHNVRLREMAVKRKWKLNEWGLFDGDKPLAGEDEADIYKKLGLSYIPPEQREDRGEFEPEAHTTLITLDDIRGDLHMHTDASDGTCDARTMARAAQERGYEYIAVTDHSKSSAIANGLSIDRMWKQIERIRELNKTLKAITVLVGCECDILSDGKLDYPDQILAACDFVVASVHSALRQDRKKVTSRVLKAMENPFVTLLGHPTGRLINKREAMDLDMTAVIAKAVETGTALELNAAWQRLDLCDLHVRQARDAGVMLCIDTDSHSTAQLDQMRLGILTARRGWLRKQDVLNTRPLPDLRKWIQKKREKA